MPISSNNLLVKILFHEFLSCINDYIERMAIFTALAKTYSIEYFCNTEVPRLGKIFVQWLYSICWMYVYVFTNFHVSEILSQGPEFPFNYLINTPQVSL